ncbi:AAA family ATPase [Caldanaerobacter subterraneus KAk]|uniref:AAA family ATPase n=1 Tax=Caldanaerobacter subterraneus TaxID=911092 RepID=UPI0032BFBEEC
MNLIKETAEVLCKNIPYFQGQRHHLTLALAGWLRKRNFTREEVEEIVRLIALRFDDDEIDARIHNVQTTFEQDLSNVAGWSSLVEIIGEETAHELDAKIPRIFLYTAEDEMPLFRILRYDTAQRKTFKTQHFDGKEWKDGLGSARKVLYKLPKVREAIEKGETIFIVEGEKCVHAMEKLGLIATTNPFGAGHWQDTFSEQLQGAQKVVILPDNDSAGLKHAEKVKASLEKHGINARIVELPNLEKGGDIADLITRGGIDREKLLNLVENNKEVPHILIPVLPLAQAVERAKTLGEGQWLIEKVLPERGLGVLAGRPKLGKTELLIKLISDILTGADSFGRKTQSKKVFWLTQEDSVTRLAQGLLRYGVDPTLLETSVYVLDYTQLRTTIKGEDVLYTAKELGVGVCIVEPLVALKELAVLGRSGKLSYEAIYDVLLPLALKAKNHGVFILGVMHSPKGRSVVKDIADVVEAPMGSTSYSAVADSIIGFGLPPNARTNAERRVMAAGRDVNLDAILQWNGSRYVEADTSFELFLITPERRQVLEALAQLGKATPSELSRYLEKNLNTTKWLLLQLKDEGLVVSANGIYELSGEACKILKL